MKKETITRKLKGEVVSDKMSETAVVAVTRLKKHSKYLKHFKVTRRFQAHNEGNEYKEGDKVIIEACKPMSKTKRFRIIGLAGKGLMKGKEGSRGSDIELREERNKKPEEGSEA